MELRGAIDSTGDYGSWLSRQARPYRAARRPTALQAIAMQPEPTLAQFRDDIADLLDIDARIRALEMGAARSDALFSGLKDEVRSMKSDLITAIEKNGPRSPWPAVSALAAVFAVILVVAAAVYQR